MNEQAEQAAWNAHMPTSCCADTVKWRAENDIENTLAAFLPEGKDDIVRKHIPSGFVGFDKSVRVRCLTSHVDWLTCNGEPTSKATAMAI